MQSSTILALFICLSLAFVKIPLKRFYKDQLEASNSTIPNMTEFLTTSYLNNFYNFGYSAQIHVGSPWELFTVRIGTASPYLWIPSKRCQNVCHPASNYFDPYSSSTYKNLGQYNRITYADSSFAQGDLSKETFYFGDSPPSTNKGKKSLTIGYIYYLTITDQVFTLVHQDSGIEWDTDGFLGLSFGGALGYPTFLDNLKIQGKISQKIFSVYLYDNDFVASYYDSSSLILGGYDLASYAQSTEIKYIDILQNDGFWNLQISNIKANNVPIPSRAYTACLDIGAFIIATPKVVFDGFYNQLSIAGSCWLDNGFIVCDCYNYAIGTYPSISFVFGWKYTFSLEPEHYFYKVGKSCTFLFYNYGDYWLIGQPFFRKYYTIFDAEYLQIGFALAKNRKTTKFIDFLGTEANLNDEEKIKNIQNEAQAEEKVMKYKSQSSTTIPFYWAISVILFVFLSGFIYCSYKQKKENPQEIYYQKILA